jgi:hypothetical protein
MKLFYDDENLNLYEKEKNPKKVKYRVGNYFIGVHSWRDIYPQKFDL